MSGLFTAIQTAGNALGVQSRLLQVTQNNLLNASTPGYARQSLTLLADPFNPESGLYGGVKAGAMVSSRSEFAESTVRTQTALIEKDQTLGRLLKYASAWLEGGDLSGSYGLMGAFDIFNDALRSWAGSPEDDLVKQRVITEADSLARAFRDASEGLNEARNDTLYELRMAIERVNQILSDLQKIQAGFTQGELQQGGEASYYAGLEELSRYLDIRIVQNPQGFPTVTTATGAMLLSGQQYFPLSVAFVPPAAGAAYPGAQPSIKLLSADGNDLTASIRGGRMAALLEGLTQIFPSLIGDANQQGALNRLAESFATRVNSIVTGGRTMQNPPRAGVALFQLDGAGTAAASAVRVNTAVNTATLASYPAGSAGDSRSLPAQLLALANPAGQQDTMQPENRSHLGFLQDLTTRLAGRIASASRSEQVHTQVLDQARAIRERVSGVSLEQEAVELLQFQRSFEAITKIISVLDELVEATLQLVR